MEEILKLRKSVKRNNLIFMHCVSAILHVRECKFEENAIF